VTPRVRLGAVGYLNARPHVFGLERSARFELRFDLPSRCADLLHGGAIDVGLIPSIEYLQGPAEAGPQYRIVPDVAIASRGPVASVVLYTRKPMRDVESIALDTSSRTSVALARVLCAREFNIRPRLEARGPDLEAMLEGCDAALIIGDTALFLDQEEAGRRVSATIEAIDLGSLWTTRTGLPFVYAFWAGRPAVLTRDDVRALQAARDAGVANIAILVRDYFAEPEHQAKGARYLRDNIRYHLGPDERAGLELFFRYAEEAGVVPAVRPLEFYDV
jgi:chorismate dehydratase